MVIKQVGVTDRDEFWQEGIEYYWYKFMVCSSEKLYSKGTIRLNGGIHTMASYTNFIIYKDQQ